ncbi:small-subunit processome [Gigaspora rosea]|uniref:Small-subunit processome n=1 Tax=Gigaspora rosea TaxID=44941 RepID=A0A397UYU5_9GLOM|nr:small-subunit processome [Gigaspora rosea]
MNTKNLKLDNFFEEIDEESEDFIEDDHEESEDLIDDQKIDDAKADNLISFIGSLDKKRKRVDNDDPTEKQKKQIKERTEAYEESEYNLTTRESSTASLESGGNKGTYKDPLPAPLPQNIQNRLNRQVAYEETKKDISKWEPIVRQNRESDHLKFPINPIPEHTPTVGVLTGTFKPSTSLEKEVDSILEKSGMKEEDLQKYEDIQLNKLSVDEVAARRSELRRMRELMYREEIKAKRIAKIKSKTFRKIKKKEKEKEKLKLDQLIEPNQNLAQEERMKLETARAKERMTLKHKNTSKWAKQALKHGRHDSESRQAIVEQLKRHEDLKRKIHDLGSDEELDDVSSESNNEDDESIIKEKAFDELEQYQLKDSADEEPVKGILGMKFMQDAMKREKKATQQLIDDFIEDLENNDFSDDDDDDDDKNKLTKKNNDAAKDSARLIDNNLGRMIFGVGTKEKGARSNDSSNARVSFDQGPDITTLSKSTFDQKNDSEVSLLSEPRSNNDSVNQQVESQQNDSEEINPWLQHDTSKLVTSSKKVNRSINIKNSNKLDKLSSKLNKQKHGMQMKEDIEIDMNKIMTVHVADNNTKKEVKTAATDNSAIENVNIESDSDDDANAEAIKNFVNVKNPTAFTQRELVARAFANDNVVEEFESEKQAIIEEDMPKEIDITLPGWGTWGGKGVKPSKNKKKIIAKPLPGEGIDVKKRQDAKLKHVIINEKSIKKAKKYLSTDIPYPFETREQYERSLRTPVGKEWNTNEVFQKMITPRVVTKMGVVIDPLTAPFKPGTEIN